MSNWQRLDTKIVYQNSSITVHEDSVITPHGHSSTYGWVETPPAVMVVALDADENVMLVKRQRYTSGQPSWELPSGSSNGQDAIEAGKRELEEEAKLHADKWVKLSGETYVWSGIATQRDTVLIAHGLHHAKNPKPAIGNDDAIDGVQAFSWDQVKDMIKSGELNDGESITALTLAGLHLERLK
jgi:8-oxo-dGTP pyrophosphatase MutT (NUDIX family)